MKSYTFPSVLGVSEPATLTALNKSNGFLILSCNNGEDFQLKIRPCNSDVFKSLKPYIGKKITFIEDECEYCAGMEDDWIIAIERMPMCKDSLFMLQKGEE